MRFQPFNEWEGAGKAKWKRNTPDKRLGVREGDTHSSIAHELLTHLDKVQGGKHIHEDTAPWVFKSSVRKKAYESRIHFLQTDHSTSEAHALAWRILLLPQTSGTASSDAQTRVLMATIPPFPSCVAVVDHC